MTDLSFSRLSSLLGRSLTDPVVQNLLKSDLHKLERDSFYGSIDFPDTGLEIVLKEAEWVIPPDAINDRKELVVTGFHMHRAGHDDYAGYKGDLPDGLSFNDSETDVRRKLGQPLSSGGGDYNSALKSIIPYWIDYERGSALLNIQFDDDRKVELLTFYIPDLDDGYRLHPSRLCLNDSC